MFEPKPIRKDAVPGAIEKAERYRLLNQPRQAESICRDVLRVDPDNQAALVTLVLALTDQFPLKYNVEIRGTQEILKRIDGEYEKAYYDGVIHERWGKALFRGGALAEVAGGWLRKAMDHFDRAEKVSPTNNDEAILRWNACARLMNRLESGKPAAEAPGDDALFIDEIPPA